MLDPLMSISPVDGRYRAQTEQLADYFSEFALIRYRVRVEIEYFIALCAIPLPQLVGVHPSLFPAMRKIYQEFTLKDASEIKATEKVTNHDVKAVEYFIKERFKKMGLERYIEFVHFGLTSQDINNTATPLSLLEGIRDLYIPTLETLISVLRKMEQ
jgi:adenylosuccinate lyase